MRATIFLAISNCFQNTVVFSNSSTRPQVVWAKTVERKQMLASKAPLMTPNARAIGRTLNTVLKVNTTTPPSSDKAASF